MAEAESWMLRHSSRSEAPPLRKQFFYSTLWRDEMNCEAYALADLSLFILQNSLCSIS